MRVSVKKWGNSAAVRIPAAVLDAAHVQIDEEVDIREEDGRIVIEAAREKKYKLDDLLKGITKSYWQIRSRASIGTPERQFGSGKRRRRSWLTCVRRLQR